VSEDLYPYCLSELGLLPVPFAHTLTKVKLGSPGNGTSTWNAPGVFLFLSLPLPPSLCLSLSVSLCINPTLLSHVKPVLELGLSTIIRLHD